jgi:hypothetical protein
MIQQNINTNDFGERAVRHGECMLIPVDALPDGAKQTFSGNQYVVAHSETGHNHVAVGDIRVFTFGDRTFIEAVRDSKIEHLKTFEQHPTQPLFKGFFEVTVKKSYDYFKKRLENVRD